MRPWGGAAMAVIGGLFLISSITALITGKTLPVYSLFAEKSRLLWKDKVHYFYVFVGITLLVLGILFATGVIGKK